MSKAFEAFTFEEFTTARDLRAELWRTCGIDGAAAEIVVRETAHHRAAWRMGQAIAAAMNWATFIEPKSGWTPAWVRGAAWLACVLDAHGVGGRLDLEGAGTLRHPAFRAIAARKHASGGPAWSAAIEAARLRLADEVTRDAELGYGTHYAVGLVDTGELGLVALGAECHTLVSEYGDPAADRPWRRALLGARLLHLLDMMPLRATWCECQGGCRMLVRVSAGINDLDAADEAEAEARRLAEQRAAVEG